jgi:hypothetical protein
VDEQLRSAREALTAELQSLSAAAARGAAELLAHVYANHRPRAVGSPRVDPSKVTGDTIKACLVSAMMDYHPDRNQGHGDTWSVLSLEITKELTAKHSTLKACD